MSEFVAPLDSDEEEMEKARVKKEKKLKKIMELQQIDQEMMCPNSGSLTCGGSQSV